jgi:8-oxo-dGTP pyrophosphatase MutT (NUDIX family)
MIAPPEVVAQVQAVRRSLALYLKSSIQKTHDGAVHAWESRDRGGKESWGPNDKELAILNGVPLEPALPDYDQLQASIPEPPFTGDAAGVILLEPDGRVWTVSPKNEFGGYRTTFPKGRLDPGETPQEAAIRETWEETGLVGKIESFLGDFERTTTTTRYYVGYRVAGAPWAMGSETGIVHLQPLDDKLAADLRNVKGEVTSDHHVLIALKMRAMGKTHEGALRAWESRRRNAEAKKTGEVGLKPGEEWRTIYGRKIGFNPSDKVQRALAELPATYQQLQLPGHHLSYKNIEDIRHAAEFWQESHDGSNALSWAVSIYRQGGQDALDAWIHDPQMTSYFGAKDEWAKERAALNVPGLVQALDHAPLETMTPIWRSLNEFDMKRFGSLKEGDEFQMIGPKGFSHAEDMKHFNGFNVMVIEGPVRAVNFEGMHAQFHTEEEVITAGKFKITKIVDVPEPVYSSEPKLHHYIHARYIGKRQARMVRIWFVQQVDTGVDPKFPDLTRDLCASFSESLRPTIGKTYSIYDLRLDYTRQERVAASVDLMQASDDPEVKADIEAASAYSGYVQWGRAVSDASAAYIQEGDSGLETWISQIYESANSREYGLDFEPEEVRLDGEPIKTSAEVSARAAKRLVEHVRHSPGRTVDVWRGLHASKPIPELDALAEGAIVKIDRLASFSAKQKTAIQFAERGHDPVNYEYLLHVQGASQGVNLDALADRHQCEYVTQGEFKVESVVKEEAQFKRPSGLTYPVQRATITLSQTKVY